MNAPADIFGYILVSLAAVLAAWESRSYARARVEHDWLASPRRHWRRLAIAAVFGCIGVLMVLQGQGLIPLDSRRPALAAVYLGAIVLLSIFIVGLALADLAETANSASGRAMKDLEQAIEEEELRKLARPRQAEAAKPTPTTPGRAPDSTPPDGRD